jgi:hypothetical protein
MNQFQKLVLPVAGVLASIRLLFPIVRGYDTLLWLVFHVRRYGGTTFGQVLEIFILAGVVILLTGRKGSRQ